MTGYDLEELRGLSLARQFPDVVGRDATAVVDAVARSGPIQSQSARAPFVGLGARLPGLTHEAITEAYESLAIVRGSNIRGTVHTSTADDQALLDATTRVGNRPLWSRMLRLDHTELEEVWAAIEGFADDEWRTPAELLGFLKGWLAGHGEEASSSRLDHDGGRYFAFGHGGLVRRPLTGAWSGQGAPGYRTAAALLPGRVVPDDPVLEAARHHLAAHGPSSRHDLAWWSGLGLRQVDALLERLGPDWREGPDGRAYADLPGAPPPRDLPGVRLLPEFDALLCGYDPKARDRFVGTADNEVLWHRANGLMLAPLLVDGRIGGHWRLDGTGRARSLTVTSFPGSRRPRRTEVDDAVAALVAGLGVTVSVVAFGD
ncbi:winged helix DNA-binding domain-containing protein [Nocardioides cynanchi]|uniref:winged helix DNA-binding domain-containing protein n=1 Tax=Nocardioides cynanchi TaxID=2558918 RepID=UPI001245B01B|nr:winged helix DNA-binding domain-containing protein [Nocardioides cynanchi]